MEGLFRLIGIRTFVRLDRLPCLIYLDYNPYALIIAIRGLTFTLALARIRVSK